MKLSNTRLATLIHGAYRCIPQPNGYLTFCRYDEAQCRYLEFNPFFHEHAFFTASVTIEFTTDAKEVAFDYKVYNVGLKDTIWTQDSIDVYVNGTAFAIRQAASLSEKGSLAFQLPEGKKKVTIYLPIDANLGIKNFRIEGKWRKTVKKAPKVLWIGDSITQGFGAFLAGQTYVNVANRILGYEILNQGIGGYYYDAAILTPMTDFQPDKIIIAMGTNQFLREDKKEAITAFYEQLAKIYPHVPVLAITPLWRNDHSQHRVAFDECVAIIRECAKKNANVTVLNGLTLIPGCTEYYVDGLHPNALGMTLYGQNLAAQIKKLGW